MNDTDKILAAMRGPLMGMPASVGAIARHADVEDLPAKLQALVADGTLRTGQINPTTPCWMIPR